MIRSTAIQQPKLAHIVTKKQPKGFEMTKYETWQDLRKQVKVARSERDAQQSAITKCEWNNPEKACITVFQIQSIGVPTENQSDSNFSMRHCDEFYKPCENKTCPMYPQYREYQEAETVLQGLKKARNKAFWNMFVRSK